MATTTATIDEKTFRQMSLADPDGQWELYDGHPRERPGMSATHGDTLEELVAALKRQLDRREFRVRSQHARLRVSPDTYYIPDVAVIPSGMVGPLLGNPRLLDAYPDPVPLVVEIWSPSTGEYDIRVKLLGYQQRGDLEIWRLNPYDRTLTAWRRQADGSYAESSYRGGIVHPQSLPGVAIDLDDICAE